MVQMCGCVQRASGSGGRRAGECVTVAVDSYLVDCQEEKLRLGRGKVVCALALAADSALRFFVRLRYKIIDNKRKMT